MAFTSTLLSDAGKVNYTQVTCGCSGVSDHQGQHQFYVTSPFHFIFTLIKNAGTHLVRAPVPASYYGNPKQHPGPGQVPCGRIPQQAEGILSGRVAVGGDVVAIGLQGWEVPRHGRAVFGQQSAVASYFNKG